MLKTGNRSFMGSLICLFCICSSFAFAEAIKEFGSKQGSPWVNTPKGKFECQNDKSTGYRQVLRLNGKEIFRASGPVQPGGDDVTSGIATDADCFEVLGVKNGIVLISRSVQPPHYQVESYAVIDFNVDPAKVHELAVVSKDDPKIEWKDKSVKIYFTGYGQKKECCTDKSPKAKKHQAEFNFDTKQIEE